MNNKVLELDKILIHTAKEVAKQPVETWAGSVSKLVGYLSAHTDTPTYTNFVQELQQSLDLYLTSRRSLMSEGRKGEDFTP
jgi:hypothetical protein